MKLLFITALAWAQVFGETRVYDLLEPNEAQQLIDQQDTSLKYAPKIETNVPALRYLGKDLHHVLEDIYLAKQYHGQDGLGGYLYGYSVPDIAKTERKKAGGDLRGAYNYVNGAGQEIKVEYWDDGTGFHQIDNVPKILPKQIDDTPAVKAAKEEHLRRWQEEAERNSKPVANPYPQYSSNQGTLSVSGPQTQYSQKFYESGQYQGQSTQTVNQYKTAPPQDIYQGQQSESVGQYQQNSDGQYKPKEEEPQGPPRGFFYSYDYPVGIIVKEEGLVKKGEDSRVKRSAVQYIYY